MVNILFLILLIAFIIPTKAYAYLDPGAGSHLLQLILGLVLGMLFSVKIFWKRIRVFFKRLLGL